MSTDKSDRAPAKSLVAAYLDKRMDELRGVRTQREIAQIAGFLRPNILSMLKSGESKLPLERIPGLARALDADPAHLFRLAMADHWPELAATIGEIFGGQIATVNEIGIFNTKWRIVTGNSDPAPNARIDAAVDAMLAELFAGPGVFR